MKKIVWCFKIVPQLNATSFLVVTGPATKKSPMRIFTSLLCLVACAAKKHLVSRQITFGVTQYKAFANDLKNHDAAESACTKW